MSTHLACVFDGPETALAVARMLSGNADVETLPPDGYLEGIYFNIASFGHLNDADGNPILCPQTGEPGYCLIGQWHAPADTVPAPLLPWMVDPTTFPVVWG